MIFCCAVDVAAVLPELASALAALVSPLKNVYMAVF